MTERPINLKAHEVIAILDGRKTQLRRLVEGTVELHPSTEYVSKGWPLGQIGDRLWARETWGSADHYYQDHENDDPSVVAYAADRSAIQFNAKTPRPTPSWDIAQWNWDKMRWRPNINMPRWASRITLEITGLRVEQLWCISNSDVEAEGVPRVEGDPDGYPCLSCNGGSGIDSEGCVACFNTGVSPQAHFARLWDGDHNGRKNLPPHLRGGRVGQWASNPWVWRVSFKRVST